MNEIQNAVFNSSTKKLFSKTSTTIRLNNLVVGRPVRAAAVAGAGLLPRVHPPLLFLLQVSNLGE